LEEENLLTIGQIASICNVTPKTLRYYDKLGLLRPAKINIQNGYRFYFKSHITRVITIKQLQEIGVSLEQIGRFYKKNAGTDIINRLSDIIEKQEKEIVFQMEELSKKLSKINIMRSQCNNIRDIIPDDNNFIIKQLSDRNIIYKEYAGKYSADIFRESYKSILDSIILSVQDLKNITSPPLAIYNSRLEPEHVDIQIGYQINTKHVSDDINQKTINGGLYACDVYQGPYDGLKVKFYNDLYEKIRINNFTVTGEPIEIFYISEVFTDFSNDYLTEIQIPIK
jgi:DNA-binding transcriptional MerR regulator